MRLALALLVASVSAFAQTSLVATYANMVVGLGGRIEFQNDGMLVARDTGAALQYFAPLVPAVTPLGALTGATTTLNGAINNSVTTVVVTADICTVPCIIKVGTEYMRVTSKATVTYTVTRAYDSANGGSGGAAASHSNGDTVTLQNWVWLNQSSATIDVANGSFYLSAAAVSGTHNAIALMKPVSGNFTVNAMVGMLCPSTTTWDCMAGIVFRESSSGKLWTCQWENSNTSQSWFTSAVYWTGATAPSATQVTDNYRSAGASDFGLIQAYDNGTDRGCKVSADAGTHWQDYAHVTRTNNLTADEVGFFMNAYVGAATYTMTSLLLSWSGI